MKIPMEMFIPMQGRRVIFSPWDLENSGMAVDSQRPSTRRKRWRVHWERRNDKRGGDGGEAGEGQVGD